MQEWVSIYETNECDIGILDIHKFPQVNGLSTGPPGKGCHNMVLELRYTITYSMLGMGLGYGVAV